MLVLSLQVFGRLKKAAAKNDSFLGEGAGRGKIVRETPPYTLPREGIARPLVPRTNLPNTYGVITNVFWCY